MKRLYTFMGGAVLACASLLMDTTANAQLYSFSTHTFTPSGATGRFGPTLVDCQTAYSGEAWASDLSFFNMTTQGIQEWTVPTTGDYEIQVVGAQGGTGGCNIGGLGASMTGTFSLTEGDVILIVAGQIGVENLGCGANDGGPGGGGSYVVDQATMTPLIIAGGGGGGGSSTPGQDAVAIEDGTNGTGAFGFGGINGGGGGGAQNGTSGDGVTVGGTGTGCSWGTGGGGFYSRGGYNCSGAAPLISGFGFIDGDAVGGEADLARGGTEGGFGGGGGVGHRSSGGGGYSGGGGDGGTSGAGGGGSYNTGTDQTNVGGANSGDGYVTITLLCNPLTTTVSSDSLCDGETVILHAASTGSGTITWSGGITDSVAFTPSAGTTTYTATSSDVDDCPFSVDIVVFDLPTVDAGMDTSVCDGDSLVLAGMGTATSWSWDGGVTDGVGFVPPTGTTMYTVVGTIDSTGCMAEDSIEVSTITVDATVTASGTELIANQAGASYQWVDCPAYTAIGGETSQNFTPPADGEYAVIVDLGGCVDTSDCQNVFVGIPDLSNGKSAVVFPNPTTDMVTIYAKGEFSYQLMDAKGSVLQVGTAKDSEEISLMDLPAGIYMINVSNETSTTPIKVVKK